MSKDMLEYHMNERNHHYEHSYRHLNKARDMINAGKPKLAKHHMRQMIHHNKMGRAHHTMYNKLAYSHFEGHSVKDT
jgi:hypothetical protein